MKIHKKRPGRPGKNHNILKSTKAQYLALPLAILLLLLHLSGCGTRKAPTAAEVLSALVTQQTDLPAGDIYLLPNGASLGAFPDTGGTPDASIPTYTADGTLLDALFGESNIGCQAKEIWQLSSAYADDGALFLPRGSKSDLPFEILVIRCPDRTGTDTVARLLLERLELLRRQYQDGEGQDTAQAGRVMILGRFVILAVGIDVKEAEDRARKIIY